MPHTEIYYIDNRDLIENYSRMNYIQINSTLPYNTYLINSQTKMYNQDGVYSGMYYTNKSIQINTLDNTANSTITNTLSIEDRGILFFMRSHVNVSSILGSQTISEPTFQSGVYLDKNMKIIVDILPNIEKTIKITLVISD